MFNDHDQPDPHEFDPFPVPAGAESVGICHPYDYYCTECGGELSYEVGDPGQTSGPPEKCWPSEPSGWSCDECGKTFETEWE